MSIKYGELIRETKPPSPNPQYTSLYLKAIQLTIECAQMLCHLSGNNFTSGPKDETLLHDKQGDVLKLCAWWKLANFFYNKVMGDYAWLSQGLSILFHLLVMVVILVMWMPHSVWQVNVDCRVNTRMGLCNPNCWSSVQLDNELDIIVLISPIQFFPKRYTIWMLWHTFCREVGCLQVIMPPTNLPNLWLISC